MPAARATKLLVHVPWKAAAHQDNGLRPGHHCPWGHDTSRAGQCDASSTVTTRDGPEGRDTSLPETRETTARSWGAGHHHNTSRLPEAQAPRHPPSDTLACAGSTWRRHSRACEQSHHVKRKDTNSLPLLRFSH